MPNSRQAGVRERTLFYIPIIHTAADMGTLGASVRGVKLSTLGRQGLARNAAVVEKLWEEIENVLASLPVASGRVRVYQDGLAICGHEERIVSELAEAGNRNHALLLKLRAQGATLMGTESPELLVEEYQLAAVAFAPGAAAGAAVRGRHLHDALLDKRDRFIAERINGTLDAGESGVLFVGMLHKVAKYLSSDIKVIYPLGPPRVMQRRGA
ncbi:MAG: hypothetical protein ABSF25_07710 [Bryobacteraceae bacterium]|jgi:hypothetical protein